MPCLDCGIEKGHRSQRCRNCYNKRRSQKVILDNKMVCGKCKQIKPITDFHKNKAAPTGYNYICKTCSVEKRRRWITDNLEKNREQSRAVAQRRKLDVLTHYGNGKCACVQCGFDNIVALTIDHMENNGRKERLMLGVLNRPTQFYRWLKRNNYPSGYQTLCMNCQWVKRAEFYERNYNKWEIVIMENQITRS